MHAQLLKKNKNFNLSFIVPIIIMVELTSWHSVPTNMQEI